MPVNSWLCPDSGQGSQKSAREETSPLPKQTTHPEENSPCIYIQEALLCPEVQWQTSRAPMLLEHSDQTRSWCLRSGWSTALVWLCEHHFCWLKPRCCLRGSPTSTSAQLRWVGDCAGLSAIGTYLRQSLTHTPTDGYLRTPPGTDVVLCCGSHPGRPQGLMCTWPKCPEGQAMLSAPW